MPELFDFASPLITDGCGVQYLIVFLTFLNTCGGLGDLEVGWNIVMIQPLTHILQHKTRFS